MIEHDLRLRLIDLGVDVAELEDVRLHRFHENLPREFENAVLIRRRCNNKAYRKVVAARQRRRHDRKHLDSRDGAEPRLHLRQISTGRLLANTPRL